MSHPEDAQQACARRSGPRRKTLLIVVGVVAAVAVIALRYRRAAFLRNAAEFRRRYDEPVPGWREPSASPASIGLED